MSKTSKIFRVLLAILGLTLTQMSVAQTDAMNQ
jgi:hypothetical protein